MQKSGIFISERMDYMEISKIIDGEKLSVRLSGRLDTTTAPQLEAELRRSVNGIKKLTLDFTEVEYISSAGLRVLLAAQKVMNRQGEMKLTGVNADIMEIFEITGFSEILTIELAVKYGNLPFAFSRIALPCGIVGTHLSGRADKRRA